MRKTFSVGILLASILLFMGNSPSAHADDTQSLIDRLDRMERDMQNLQLEVFQGNGHQPKTSKPAPANNVNDANIDGSALNRLDARISTLEIGLRELTGKIEEASYKINQQQSFQDKVMSDNELRLQSIEQQLKNLSAAQTAADTPPAPATPENTAAPAPSGNPQTDYDNAIGALQKSDYTAAEAAFREFLKQNPKHELAPNAQYWLAETFYVRGDYQTSAVEFLKSFKQYPKSSKAPDSLLKLGLSLSNLGKKTEACASLGKMDKEFPSASSSIKARAETERKKLKCTAQTHG